MASPDWPTIASLATAGGTLVLATATFASIRSSNRSARTAERALLAGIRPLLIPSRIEDPPIKVGFSDDRWFMVPGGQAICEVGAEVVYLVISLRNVGQGLAVLDQWDLVGERPTGVMTPRSRDHYRRLTRDIYVPPGEVGFWQGALRDRSEPMWSEACAAITSRQAFTVDVLYSDAEGGQHTITRFGVLPAGEDRWLVAAGRHWNLDRDDPR